jgi:hypothetical protein
VEHGAQRHGYNILLQSARRGGRFLFCSWSRNRRCKKVQNVISKAFAVVRKPLEIVPKGFEPVQEITQILWD